jgi:hypothetical protein
MGTCKKQSKGSVIQMEFNKLHQIIIILSKEKNCLILQGSDNFLEIISYTKRLPKKTTKAEKRKQRKAKQKEKTQSTETETTPPPEDPKPLQFRHLHTEHLATTSKAISFTQHTPKQQISKPNAPLTLILSFSDNKLSTYKLHAQIHDSTHQHKSKEKATHSQKEEEKHTTSTVGLKRSWEESTLPTQEDETEYRVWERVNRVHTESVFQRDAHRTTVRVCVLSSDDAYLLTADNCKAVLCICFFIMCR